MKLPLPDDPNGIRAELGQDDAGPVARGGASDASRVFRSKKSRPSRNTIRWFLGEIEAILARRSAMSPQTDCPTMPTGCAG